MSRFKGTMPEGEGDTTKLTARLPSMNLEITHHHSTVGGGERITIAIEAVPSFDALARVLEATNPFAYWMHAMQFAWLPWLAVARAAMLPSAMIAPPRAQGTEPKDR